MSSTDKAAYSVGLTTQKVYSLDWKEFIVRILGLGLYIILSLMIGMIGGVPVAMSVDILQGWAMMCAANNAPSSVDKAAYPVGLTTQKVYSLRLRLMKRP